MYSCYISISGYPSRLVSCCTVYFLTWCNPSCVRETLWHEFTFRDVTSWSVILVVWFRYYHYDLNTATNYNMLFLVFFQITSFFRFHLYLFYICSSWYGKRFDTRLLPVTSLSLRGRIYLVELIHLFLAFRFLQFSTVFSLLCTNFIYLNLYLYYLLLGVISTSALEAEFMYRFYWYGRVPFNVIVCISHFAFPYLVTGALDYRFLFSLSANCAS